VNDYLYHWWNGDLNNFYHFWGLTISQLNKIAKLILYLVALLTLFEFIKYRDLMNSLNIGARISVYLIRFIQTFVSIPFVILGMFYGLLAAVFQKLDFRDIPRFAFWYHFSSAEESAKRAAQSHYSVRITDWLSEQPITEKGIKKFGFFLIVIFASIEVFTS
jgi:hypothetical protein